MKKLIFTLLISGIFIQPLSAGDQDGTATAVFLRMEQGARALGMGGAFSAIGGDVESVWWNAAGAAPIESVQIMASYVSFIEEISSSYAAFAIPLGKQRGSIIGNVNYISYGSVETRDAAGNSLGDVSPSNLAASAGYAFNLSSNFSIGFIAKHIQQNLGTIKGSGVAFDAGLIIGISPKISLGLAAQNLGPKLKTEDYENKLPLNLKGGLAFAVSQKLLLAADAEKPVDAESRIHIGCELAMSKTFVIRAGYNTSSAAGFTAGAGIITPISFGSSNSDNWWKNALNSDTTHNIIRIDYAYVTTGSFETTHRLSLTFKL